MHERTSNSLRAYVYVCVIVGACLVCTRLLESALCYGYVSVRVVVCVLVCTLHNLRVHVPCERTLRVFIRVVYEF